MKRWKPPEDAIRWITERNPLISREEAHRALEAGAGIAIRRSQRTRLHFPLDDLLSVAVATVLKCALRYDGRVRFSAFCSHSVPGALANAIRDSANYPREEWYAGTYTPRLSLSVPVQDEAGDSVPRQDLIPDDRDPIGDAEGRILLDQALSGLPEKERQALEVWLETGNTAEIGRRMGHTQMHGWRLKEAALRRVRTILGVSP